MRYRGFLVTAFLFLALPGMVNSADFTRNLKELGKGQAYYLKFIKVYDATLYGEYHPGAEEIVSEKISKCLHLLYDVGISQKDFAKAADTVLSRQFPEDILAELKGSIDALHAAYRDVQEGDSYTLCYDSTTAETTLAHNGIPVVSIRSPEFSRVYFSIWLGSDEPLDERLRDDLLAGYRPHENPAGVSQ